MTYESTAPRLRTLGAILERHAQRDSSQEALSFEGRRTTYGEFDRRANQVAHGLAALGLTAHDRAAFLSKNSDLILELTFGCARAGAAVVGINWRLVAEEVAYILRDCGAKALFVSSEFVATAEQALALLPEPIPIIAFDGDHPTWPSFSSWRARHPSTAPMIAVHPEDIAVVMYTSGTTGHPKGVQLAHRCFFLLDSQPVSDDLRWAHWSPDDNNLVCMPCFHVGGLAYAIWAIIGGARQVILREFEAGAVLRTIQQERITRACIVSTAIRMCLEHPSARDFRNSTLKFIQYGASAMDEQTIRRAVQVFRCGFIQNYGMTETTGAATYLPAADHLDPSNPKLASVGKAIPGVEIKIIDATGQSLPSGTVGEICICSPANMSGYWNLPEESAQTLIEGFVRTGDAGYLDSDGYLHVVDRIKDVIKSGGENVSSIEVEHALLKHPAIADVAAIGVPDERWGEAVKALVVLAPDRQASASEIIRFARERMAAFKCPKSVDFVAQIPRNASGKILKRQLRAAYLRPAPQRADTSE